MIYYLVIKNDEKQSLFSCCWSGEAASLNYHSQLEMVQLSLLVSAILASVLSAVLVLLQPFLACFLLPLSHDYVVTDHPASPHSPPSPPHLTEEQLQEYRDEGVTVLRGVLPASLVSLLQRAVQDLMANQTLHCAMAA